MKLIQTSSRWGNLYRFRFWIDGKRCSKQEFDAIFKNMTQSQKDEAHSSAQTEYGYRDIWQF